MVDISNLGNIAMGWVISYGPKLLLAIITLIIGLWLINIFVKFFENVVEKKALDKSLRHFLASLIGIGLKVLLIISVISMVGIETTSFVAVLAAAGFAIGLALQGSLANFAGGVLILLFKPFKAGDFIETQGHMGTVDKIEIFNTILKTPDNKTIIIPNGPISNNSIINFSTEKQRRVDMTFSIGYSDNIDKAMKILEKLVKEDKRILKEPAHQIVLSALGASSVDFTVRAWVEKADYWGVYFDMQKNVKEEFDKNSISIPFPQQDIHIYKH